MVKVKTYTIAALITALLLFSGFLTSWYFNQIKQSELEQQFLDLQEKIVESQLELTYLTEFSNNSCGSLEEARRVTSINLLDVNRKLESSDKVVANEFEFERLKIEQSMNYVNLWMFARKIREQCKTNLTTMLYFWDANSMESQQQGFVLDAITNEEGDRVLIIPLDYNFNLGIIKILSKEFNITQTPTIIINEKTKLEGLQSKADIMKYL